MITVNCQSSIRIENGGLAIYFDPLKIAERHDANCIFITHSHWDHFSPEDIQKAVNESTIIVAPRDVYDKLAETGFDANKLRCVQPNDELDLDGVHVQAVPPTTSIKISTPKLIIGWATSSPLTTPSTTLWAIPTPYQKTRIFVATHYLSPLAVLTPWMQPKRQTSPTEFAPPPPSPPTTAWSSARMTTSLDISR